MINFYLLKNIFKVALQYLLKVFIQFNTVSDVKLNLKLHIFGSIYSLELSLR